MARSISLTQREHQRLRTDGDSTSTPYDSSSAHRSECGAANLMGNLIWGPLTACRVTRATRCLSQ